MSSSIPRLSRHEALEKWLADYRAIEAVAESLRALFPNIDAEGPVLGLMYQLHGTNTRLLAQSYGISEDGLDWFIYSNDCGGKGLEAVIGSKRLKVRTLDDLEKVLDAET